MFEKEETKPEKKSVAARLKPNEIFFGILLGTTAGFIPLLSPLSIVIIFLFIIFRINIAAAVVFFAAGKFLVIQYLDDFINKLGLAILSGNEPFVEFSRWFTRLPAITYLDFTNSAVMGGFVYGAVMGLPAAFIARKIILKIQAKKDMPKNIESGMKPNAL